MGITEELKKLLTNPFEGLTKVDVTCIQESCEKIAKMLFENYCIKCGNNTFRFAEIEFYYYKKEKTGDCNFDDNWNKETYPRNKNAGELFFHYSGVDICFQCHFEEKEKNDEYGEFGGILIRSLLDGDKIIAGPLFCANTMLNACKQQMPSLKQTDYQQCKYETETRCGISSDKQQERGKELSLCYYVTRVNNKELKWDVTSERISWNKKIGKFIKITRNYKKERNF